MNQPAVQVRALDAFREAGGVLRSRDALARGIHPRTLYALRDAGLLRQLGRGVYQLASQEPSSRLDLVLAAARYPKAVICLVSALDWHGLTLEVPAEVHVALPPGAETPRSDFPPIRAFRFSGKAYIAGIEEPEVDGQRIRIYGPEKTLADCFKFRNQLGMELVLDALRRYRERRRPRPALLVQFAKICRVERVMRPYLEALL